MAKLTRSITVDAPVDRVFDYALDITKLWKAKDVGLAEVDLKPDGLGTSARMYSHFLGFHLEGGLEYTEVVPGSASSPRSTSSWRIRRGPSHSHPSRAARR